MVAGLGWRCCCYDGGGGADDLRAFVGGCGGGAAAAYPLAGGAHGEGGGWELHVKRRFRRELEGLQLLQLLEQPLVLVGQRLVAPLQELAIHLRLLQLRSAR